MKDYLSEIDERFPVRNSAEEKARFRAWALAEAAELGVSRAAPEGNEGHVNLVFGEAEKARVLFTAHYDTPRRALLPNLMLVTNRFLFWAYNLALPLCMLAAAIAAAFGAKALLGLNWEQLPDRLLMLAVYMGVYFALFCLLLRGPANRHNRNDNTSGTAAVMELLRLVGEREDTACLLFDDEEKGKKGSKAFAKAHPGIRQDTLVVNLDCVGNGETAVFCPSTGAEGDPRYAALKDAVEKSGLNARFFPAGRAQTNSDHKNFDKGVGVCACFHKPFVGWYTGRIHTARDTVADPESVRALAEALASFAERL